MKIRIGLGLSAVVPSDDVAAIVDSAEEHKVDSIWFSEHIHEPHLDAVPAMAYTVARTSRLKVGTSVMVLPGRDPTLVAKQLATLCRLAPDRILPAFGVRPARPQERAHFAAPPSARAEAFDEALVLLRRLLTEPRVTFDGRFYRVSDASIGFLPIRPLDLWLGGRAPAALDRVGRLADGWLAALVTAAEANAGIRAIDETATAAGRQIDREHFGVVLLAAEDRIPDQAAAQIHTRRPDLDPEQLVTIGWSGLARAVEQFAGAGVSKFVVRPVMEQVDWLRYVTLFARHAMPLQT